jgi:LPXTG-motif cell wall-anchored protein
VLETALPLGLGIIAVHIKDVLHQLGDSAASAVLLALVVIAFLIPQLRRYALVVICFGVSVFAFQRMWAGVRVVDWQEAVWTDYAFVVMWLGIASFSGLAGIGEVWFNSPRWAQQFYLLAVALYFVGHGGSAWLQGKLLSSMFLTLIGLVALGGAAWVGWRRKPLEEPVPRPSRRRVRWTHHSPPSEKPPPHTRSEV